MHFKGGEENKWKCKIAQEHLFIHENPSCTTNLSQNMLVNRFRPYKQEVSKTLCCLKQYKIQWLKPQTTWSLFLTHNQVV